MRLDDIDEQTRRSIIKAVGGALATGAAGAAAAHPGDGTGEPNNDHDHADASLHETLGDIDQVGYHSLGGVNQDGPETPHYGGLTELRVQNGLAFVGFLSSRGPTPNRGFAILDVSDFTEARDEADVESADIDVLSFARDDNDASSVLDVKVTEDTEYAVLSREPAATFFDDPNTNKSAEGEGTSVGATSLQLWDVSDPTSPRLVSESQGFAFGPHNAYVHNIRGDDYVFAVGVLENTLGLHVYRINRTTDQLEFVNKYDKSGQVTSGGGLSGAGDAHDVTVIDDPKTGRPYVYFGMWSSPGMRVLDASDPANLEEIGTFEMDRAHYVQPAPTLIDGKRVALAGQENPNQSNEDGQDDPSGLLFLVDCDPLDEDGNSELKALDGWAWLEDTGFADYLYSPHNADITKEGWIHIGHYHGGTMFFEITDDFLNAKPGTEDAETIGSEEDEATLYESELSNFAKIADDRALGLEPAGSFKSDESVPVESRLQALQDVLPFAWSAVEANGLTFISDINSGVYVASHHDIELGTDPNIEFDVATHRDASNAFTAGQTVGMDLYLDVQVTDADLWVRTRVPGEWEVYDSDQYDVRDLGYETIVEFDTAIGAAPDDDGDTSDAEGTRTFFAEAPSETGRYTFGPLEYTTDPPEAGDGNRQWHKLVGETESNNVVGVSL